MSTHKYIVMALGGEESIFVFPPSVDHDHMAEAIGFIRFGRGRDWKREYRIDGEPVSAGFVTNGACHGNSETLGLKSRGAVDTALLGGALPAGAA